MWPFRKKQPDYVREFYNATEGRVQFLGTVSMIFHPDGTKVTGIAQCPSCKRWTTLHEAPLSSLCPYCGMPFEAHIYGANT